MSEHDLEKERTIGLIDERLGQWRETQLTWQLTVTTVNMLESLRRDILGREQRSKESCQRQASAPKFISGKPPS